MTAGLSIITNALTRVLGAQFLRDVQTFVSAIDTLFGGFRQRAQQTFRLLQADGTAFLVVAAPEPDALREAAYFVERLSEDGMPLAGLVVNRATTAPTTHASATSDLSAEEAAAAAGRLGREVPDSLAAGLLRLYADRGRLVEREASLRARFAAAHPEVPTAVVPALAGDVHDLDDLRRVGVLLGGQDDDTLPSGRRPAEGSASDGDGSSSGTGAGLLEHGTPLGVRVALEEGPALALGHPTPDAPLDLVLQGLSEALGLHRAPGAHLLGLVLLGSTHEQLVGLAHTASSLACPVFVPHD